MRPVALSSHAATGDVTAVPRGLPKAPVFGWDNLWPRGASKLPSVADLAACAYTTSGRAALHAALLQMRLAPGSPVLVPTYHCPTMVAPIIDAGHHPVFYPLASDGLPDLGWIAEAAQRLRPGAMFVPHYFGLATSLRSVQEWCRRHEVILVEDCAHAYFGMAGERPVGHWGDYATASVSKFYPVPEAGLLASASVPLQPLRLLPTGLGAQFKAGWDIVDFGCRNGRLRGLSQLLWPVRWLRDRRRCDAGGVSPGTDELPAAGTNPDCDMERKSLSVTTAARVLHRWLPTGRIVTRRRANYAALAETLAATPGARLLQPMLLPGWVPYALPLWVEGTTRADRVYAALRAQRLPVFRWDRLWPGTPKLAGDTGQQWSRHLLQLLCHQDLSPADMEQFAAQVHDSLRSIPHS